MPVLDLTQPLNTFLCMAVIVCSIFLGHEIKRAVAPAVTLILAIILLVIHSMQLFIFGGNYVEFQGVLSTSMLYDFGFILVSYLGYLWIDDIEAKYRNKKSISNSLDWFWSKI